MGESFIIQDGYDFSWHMIEAIKYNNWFHNETIYTWESDKFMSQIYHPELWIPIGSVEFVLNHLNKYFMIDNVKPINIPQALKDRNYTKRQIRNAISSESVENTTTRTYFVKDNLKIKGFSDFVNPNDITPAGEYIMSEVINIESEWRSFVYKQKLVGLQNYSGDFTMFPDVKLIKEMINVGFDDGAYTLDVGINQKDGTFVLEAHDFFSCGLYGFSDYQLLPKMFISTWNKLINKSK
jgi:hypothetical protein